MGVVKENLVRDVLLSVGGVGLLRMSKKKIKLLCYNKNHLAGKLLLLPGFGGRGFFMYNGIKYELFYLRSRFLFFFSLYSFVLSKKIGPIHRKKELGRKMPKKK
uniref:Ribosomal protein S19 n=1 Tax=Balamuthia mandrillaris TaxID=66527 RepID=A0A0K1HRW4_9EUKA|nr:ribosomal protein S19 [Balamuthia mandrillaris]AKT94923.1 ribosomal protein S19 [Balamuthia mandrillaris]